MNNTRLARDARCVMRTFAKRKVYIYIYIYISRLVFITSFDLIRTNICIRIDISSPGDSKESKLTACA